MKANNFFFVTVFAVMVLALSACGPDPCIGKECEDDSNSSQQHNIIGSCTIYGYCIDDLSQSDCNYYDGSFVPNRTCSSENNSSSSQQQQRPSSSTQQSSSSSKISSSSSFVVTGSLYDSRDDKYYKTVTIGNQIWIAENLNYNVNGSKCYNNQDSYCVIYGRYYNWNAAMSACPDGWHLPTSDNWDMLRDFVGGESVAGKHLKKKDGWFSGVGIDTYNFAALPGGIVLSSGSSTSDGIIANWWSTREYDNDNAYSIRIHAAYEGAYWDPYDKNYLLNVRCVQD
jgi:uncharacterized protein (TIGR02145 family)